jgi:hypothetical protein
MDSPLEPNPEPSFSPEKTMILSPAIAQLEKLIAELDGVMSEQLPELLGIKRESDELLRKKLMNLDKQMEYQRGQLDRQLQYEIQSVNEEIEDFVKVDS